MANSSYYYNLYKQRKSSVKTYDDDLKDLRTAFDKLTDTMGDEIRAINNELEDLKSDLKKCVRHNSKFTSHANAITSKKEKTVTADSHLSIVVRELQDEIYRISQLRNQAINEREYYYQKYKAKKEEERQNFLDKIF